MKNLFYLTVLFVTFLGGTATIKAQVAPGDFQYSATISDSLMAPTRLAIDQSDNVFAIDSYTKSIRKYDVAGTLLTTIYTGGSPLSIAVNNSNQVFVGDALSGNILKVNQNGTTSVFYSGASFPNSICFSPDNHLYIADSKLQRILVVNTAGELVQTIGQGTLIFPTGLAFDSKNNRIIVGEHGAIEDNLQTRIYIYALDGSLVNVLGSYGNSNGRFYRIQGISAGRCGNIYVCEPFQGNISVFTEGGVFITKFGQFGTGQGELNVPMDVVFDSQDRVLLASMNNGSLERFTINDPLPSAKINTNILSVCAGESTTIPVYLTGTAPWSLTYTINDQNPATITTITSNPYLLTATQPGIYKISALSDSAFTGSCFTGSATVVEKPIPTALVSGPNDQLCAGSASLIPVQLTGDAPWELSYTFNNQNPVVISNITESPYMFEVNMAGTYEITGIKGPDCDGSVLPGNNVIIVHSIPSALFQNSTISICQGQTASIPIALSGNAPWTISYTVNGQNPISITTNNNQYILSTNTAGNYQITSITDAYCAGQAPMAAATVVINPKPSSAFTHLANNTIVTFLNNSQNATYYYWSFGDSKTSTDANPVHKYKFPGVYSVTLIASNQYCGSVKSLRKVIVNNNNDPRPVTVKNNIDINDNIAISEMDLNVFPNPSNGLFTLEISNPSESDLTIEVTNVTGQLIYSSEFTYPSFNSENETYSATLDLHMFTNGIYTLKVITGETAYTAKLVLNK